MANAQITLDELQKRKTLVEAEKALIDAELARDEARRKQAAAQQANKDALADAKSAKELAEARKAEIDAEHAQLKAKFGDIPTSGISGGVKLGDKAGAFETALLATRATMTAAVKLADALQSIPFATPPARLLVFPAGEMPTFQATAAFMAQKAALATGMQSAIRSAEDLRKHAAGAERMSTESLAAVGLGLEAVTRLLGFFRTDFEIGGSELAADHLLLAEAAGGELRKRFGTTTQIYLKSMFNPSAILHVVSGLPAELQLLQGLRGKAAAIAAETERQVAALEQDVAKSGDTPAEREAKQARSARLAAERAVLDKLKTAIQACDTFFGRFLVPDDKTLAFIKEYEIWKSSQEANSYVLIVKMHKAGGSQYTEKNLWTTFGKMPFKVMGGVIVSYALFDGPSGALVRAGVVPVHGGFANADEVGTLFGPDGGR